MEPRRTSLAPQVVLFVAARMAINAAYRMVYPFLRSFASGMGVPLEAAALPLTGRSLVGALGPLLAPVADRYGRKAGMLLGLGLFCLGVGLVAAWPSCAEKEPARPWWTGSASSVRCGRGWPSPAWRRWLYRCWGKA